MRQSGSGRRFQFAAHQSSAIVVDGHGDHERDSAQAVHAVRRGSGGLCAGAVARPRGFVDGAQNSATGLTIISAGQCGPVDRRVHLGGSGDGNVPSAAAERLCVREQLACDVE